MSDIERQSSTDVKVCSSCDLVQRREFFRDAAIMAMGALVALGAAPRRAAAAPVELISALGGGREDKSYAIPSTDGTQIDKAGEAIITRWQGKVYAYSLSCPHQNTALKWYEKDNQFECPKHHSRFTPDGVYIKDSGRATRGLDRLAIRRDGANIVVNLDKAYQEDENEAAWKSAFVAI
jgi:Rieske Fe-S protein